ncbi:MAG: hypothetical protein EAZ44_08200 [Cytophagia bacterium]|nr:MAG: hypothetical protein EAZ44_08200 [Cytophagia bacterium]TAG46259.1 MAG: hypothetical protein EAZ31_00630 [Cytophagia bacterium]
MIKEITFETVRKKYQEVKNFVAQEGGNDIVEIGLYSSLEDDLGIAEDDLLDFQKKFRIYFEIDNPTNNEMQSPNNISYLLIFIIIILIPLILILLLLFAIFKFFFDYNKTNIPSKKEWKKDKISVADLVCMAIEKKYILKKNITYKIS